MVPLEMDAPTNLLTGFGFFNPYWLIDIANVFIMVHLVGAYQVWDSVTLSGCVLQVKGHCQPQWESGVLNCKECCININIRQGHSCPTNGRHQGQTVLTPR